MAKKNNANLSNREKFSDWIENAPIPIMLHADDGTVIKVSNIWTDATGYTIEDIPTLETWADKALGSRKEEAKEIIDSLFEKGSRQRVGDFPIEAKDGHVQIWDFYSAYIGQWEDGRKVVLSAAVDVTARKNLEEDLWQKKIFLETTLISVADGVIAADQNGRVLFMNKSAEILTGWTQNEANGRPINEIYCLADRYTYNKILNLVHTVLETRKSLEIGKNTMLISKDGREMLIEDSISPIMHENGDISGVVIVFRDTTEKQRKENEIQFLSYHDQLTGLYNRRFYTEELHRLDTQRNYPISLIMADINGLKLANDAFGHTAGDNLLRRVAVILQGECRADDILARIGGDEFVILLPRTDALQTRRIISRINRTIANEKTDKMLLSVSLGAAEKRDATVSMHDVFIRAEDEMYRNKLANSTNIKSRSLVLILNTIYEKNKDEMARSRRVGQLCEQIAVELHFDRTDVNQIRTAGLLHDIGNIGLEGNILEKPRKLSEDEWYEVKKHPEIGYRILNSVDELSDVAGFVLQHQERWDGKGYPKALKGEEISVQARIIGIASAYEAMISARPYMETFTREKAADEIKKFAGYQFDPAIAKVFVEKILGEKW